MIGGFVCAATHPSGCTAVVLVGHTGATIGPGSFMHVTIMLGE
jgi:hypothetical protein